MAEPMSRGLLCAGCGEVFLLDGHTFGAAVGSECDCGCDGAVFVRAVVLDADAHAAEREAVRECLGWNCYQRVRLPMTGLYASVCCECRQVVTRDRPDHPHAADCHVGRVEALMEVPDA